MIPKKAVVMGVHSFLDHNVRVGTQYISEGLAELGWQVDYISVPSSPFDLLERERRKRFQRVWIQRQDLRGIAVKPNLTEYALRSLHPAHKLFLRNYRMLEWFSLLTPDWLQKRHYDICIHDITVNTLFLPMIRSDLKVLRMNDPPEGFGFHIHQTLIDRFRENIALQVYDEIWAVSEPLAKYALNLNPANRVTMMPNGIEDSFASLARYGKHRPRQAVYLGSVSPWVDLELLDHAALLLPDWQFHIYGQCSRPWTVRSTNVQKFGPVNRARVPSLLAEYEVGLIPFRDISDRMDYVERPLKFYEYIGAGLGIASTDIGALKKGMGDMASYGNTPLGFAQAIEKAAQDRKSRTDDFNRAFVEKHAWRNIVRGMDARISRLLAARRISG